MNEQRLQELRELLPEVDRDLHRAFPFEIEAVRDSGDPETKNWYTMIGHAAVFNRWSLDLGGFRERVKTGAFDDALSRDPHVVHTIDHDTSKTLASTRSKPVTLELSTDPKGLRYFSKIKPTSYALDLRMNLEDGTINQSSFAFTVKRDEWKIIDEDGDERVERTIIEVDELFDVTTCAMGAYPSTDAALAVRSLVVGRSLRAGPVVAPLAGDEKEVAPVVPEGMPQTSDEDVKRELQRLKRQADEAFARATERVLKRGGTQ